MKVRFKTYRKRNGDLMVYLNGSNGVSLGLSGEGVGFQTSKATKGQKNLHVAAIQYFDENATEFTGDIEAHTEEKVKCGLFTLLITDTATVGGVTVDSDGAYLVKDNKILKV